MFRESCAAQRAACRRHAESEGGCGIRQEGGEVPAIKRIRAGESVPAQLSQLKPVNISVWIMSRGKRTE